MKITSLLSFALIFILFSCEKEPSETITPTERLLKRKLLFDSPEETTPRYILTYDYDLNKRLVRILGNSYNERIDSFKYNSTGQVIEKHAYEMNYTKKYIFLDSMVYKYQDGNLVRELSYDPYYHQLRRKIRYEYSNSKLLGKYEYNFTGIYEYNNPHFVSYTRYEYSGENCTKETCYTDSLGSKLSTYQHHYFKKSKLIGTEIYGFNGSLLQVNKYTFDGEGNLITEEARQGNPEAYEPYFYVYRYEYQ